MYLSLFYRMVYSYSRHKEPTCSQQSPLRHHIAIELLFISPFLLQEDLLTAQTVPIHQCYQCNIIRTPSEGGDCSRTERSVHEACRPPTKQQIAVGVGICSDLLIPARCPRPASSSPKYDPSSATTSQHHPRTGPQ